MDHDRLFKELLSTFFIEFIDLFLPDVGAYLDQAAPLVPMDKEIFTDVTLGGKHEVDLLMRARFRGNEAFFLIHVENQSTPQSDFPKRMFRYFARLTEKYDLPVYPVVVFSYDTPRRSEPDRYVVAFPGETVLQMKSPPEQAPGYLPEGRPESRLTASAPERAEKPKAGSAASCGE